MQGWRSTAVRLWQRAWTANQELAGGLGSANCMILPRTLLPSCRTPDLKTAGGQRSFRAPAGGTSTLVPPTAKSQNEGPPHTSSPNPSETPQPIEAIAEPDRLSNGHRPPGARESRAGRRPRQTRGGTEGDDGLRRIAGIGPVSVLKLRNKGHDSIKSLSELYTNKLQSDQLRLIEYLKGEVGLRSKPQCTQIAKFLQGWQLENKQVTLCVEGNISAGKSTFLNVIRKTLCELKRDVEVVPEPVEEWQTIGGPDGNILNAFYRAPERYAYTFQNYVFLTRCNQELQSRQQSGGMRLLERSVWSDRMVFVRAVLEANWMDKMELSVYDSWFNPMTTTIPGLCPDGFIYLKADPDVCSERMARRARSEEGGVKLEYLEQLHKMHEEWLGQRGFEGQPQVQQLIIPGQHRPPDAAPLGSAEVFNRDLPDILKDKVKKLSVDKNTGLHPVLNQVPALELDCGAGYDLLKNKSTQLEYAEMVKAYFDWVKEERACKAVKSALGMDSDLATTQSAADYARMQSGHGNGLATATH